MRGPEAARNEVRHQVPVPGHEDLSAGVYIKFLTPPMKDHHGCVGEEYNVKTGKGKQYYHLILRLLEKISRGEGDENNIGEENHKI